MSITLTTDVITEPIQLADLKEHLRVETDDDDIILHHIIIAARMSVETRIRTNLIARTWQYKRHTFPGVNHFGLPKNPVVSVESITYIDAAGAEQTLSTDVYDVDLGVNPAVVHLKYNQSWPSTRADRNAVTVNFIAGYAAGGTTSPLDPAFLIPSPIKQAIRMVCGDLYENREEVALIFGGGHVAVLPTADRLLAPYRNYSP